MSELPSIQDSFPTDLSRLREQFQRAEARLADLIERTFLPIEGAVRPDGAELTMAMLEHIKSREALHGDSHYFEVSPETFEAYKKLIDGPIRPPEQEVQLSPYSTYPQGNRSQRRAAKAQQRKRGAS